MEEEELQVSPDWIDTGQFSDSRAIRTHLRDRGSVAIISGHLFNGVTGHAAVLAACRPASYNYNYNYKDYKERTERLAPLNEDK